MIKNVTVKKILKNSIFKIANIINKIIPKKEDVVLLYSANKGIQHSLVPLRKYILDNELHENYKIYCGIENMKYADNDGLNYISRFSAYRLFFQAKHVFYTTGQIPIKPSKGQCVIHLRHGNTNYKTMGKLTKINNGNEFFFTYMAASAPIYKPIMAKEFGCKEENIAVVGDPIIDELLDNKPNTYDFSKYSKLILWVPTFRQSDYLGYNDSEYEELVPLFQESDYESLNKWLEKYNIKMIVKLHPAQKDSKQSKRHYTNLDIYTHDEFIKNGFSLYPLMYQSDALIGDYSSASMQYLVLNKPQAYVIPDFEQYKCKRGFVFDNPKDYMAGHIITRIEEFYCFIEDISKDNDKYKEKRQKVRNTLYKYCDNNNCRRIIELSGIKMEHIDV